MEYNQIGYSNIRLPSDRNSRLYQYSSYNTFPQEVLLHEFLHTLERNEQDNGNNNIAELHDNNIYGYQEQRTNGLENWYRAYMQNNIQNAPDKGLTDFAYSSKPIYESNFEYSIELDYLDEPDNILEEVSSIIKRVGALFTNLKNQTNSLEEH